MDMTTSQAIKLLGPKVPLMLKTVALHSLGLSHTSSKWDLKTELFIHVLRSVIDTAHPRSLSVQQKVSIRDPGVKGPVWISKVKADIPPEDDVRQTLFSAIDAMKTGEETYTKPEYQPVEAEWTGYRAGVSKDSPEPSLSEPEKFKKLMAETKSDVTILYFHGGAYYLLDPASHRPVVSRLAKLTGGRALSVRYRLAPQNPFPAALLDALLSYLYLLYPPPSALHDPIPASKIVFAGDSAGGNLSFALLELILQIHRTAPQGQNPTVKFQGKDVEIPLPAGVTGNSPWVDTTRSLPSLEGNAKYDFLPPPSHSMALTFPPCEIWPAKPPRADIYCDGNTMLHPLVSPLAAKDWKGAPPVFIGCGEELLADEDAMFAQTLVGQGVTVVWEQYEAMPHCFAMMLEGHKGGKMFFEQWAGFIKAAVDQPGDLKTRGTLVTAKKLGRKSVDIASLRSWSEDEVLRMMKDAQDKRLKGFETEAKALPRL